MSATRPARLPMKCKEDWSAHCKVLEHEHRDPVGAQVLDHREQRLAGGQLELATLAKLVAGLAARDPAGQQRGGSLAVLVSALVHAQAVRDHAERAMSLELVDVRRQRRDPLAARDVRKRGGQIRLADPALADEPHERPLIATCAPEQLDERREIALTADHRVGREARARHRPQPAAMRPSEDRSLRDVFARPTPQTAFMLRLQLQLRLKQDDPPEGELTSDDGTTVAFSGRLELLAALERFTDGNPDASPAENGTAPSATDRS